jgi:hypothetical protein
VIEFLVGRCLHLLLNPGIAGHGRVALVEALCGYFSGMIDSHQSGRMRLLISGQRRFGDIAGWIWPGSTGWRGCSGSKGAADPGQESVKRAQLSVFH